MNKYTEADYKRMHQGIIEDMVDSCLGKWHDQECDPLEARVYRNIASTLENLRDASGAAWAVNIWVSAANEEHTHTRSKS